MKNGDDLETIKKLYGERFAKNICRVHFPLILEHKGVLPEILQKYFANNGNSLYDDIVKRRN